MRTRSTALTAAAGPRFVSSARAACSVTALLTTVAVVGGFALACSRPLTVDEVSLQGHSEPLLEILAACASISDSATSRRCASLAEAIGPCEAVVASCKVGPAVTAIGVGCSLEAAVRCVEPASLFKGSGSADPAVGSGGSPAWHFRGPLSGNGPGVLDVVGYLRSQGSEQPGESDGQGGTSETVIEARIEGADESWKRFLPATAEPGPYRLSDSEGFFRLRLRPEGGLLPGRVGGVGGSAEQNGEEEQESLADRFYGLRAELFTAAVLTGDVELLLQVPEQGDLFPGSVVALDFKVRSAAITAMERYIKQLQEQWPLSRMSYRNPLGEGACIGNLRVMPGLAPCYVATDAAIVVGWNRRSLEAALGLGQANSLSGNAERLSIESGGGKSRAMLRFDRLAVADHRLAEARDRTVAFNYPYQRAELSAHREGPVSVVTLTLTGDPTVDAPGALDLKNPSSETKVDN